MSKKLSISILLLISFGVLIHYFSNVTRSHAAYSSYPHFEDNPLLNNKMRSLMRPHLLPLDHPSKLILDVIFSKGRVLENETTLTEAGFSILAAMPLSYVIVAKHPDLPGYVCKLYLDSETRMREGIPHWQWLTRRCIGAEIIRNEIKKKHIRHFTVPDKWLYILPPSEQPRAQPVIVIETDMQIESQEVTRAAWKTLVTKKHLDELYVFLKQGYGSVNLAWNVHYTKQGKFAFVDTEYPKKKQKLRVVKDYLSEEMQAYWKKISNYKEKKVKTPKEPSCEK